MKNLKLISLTLGITLLCNLNKSSAESFKYNQLLSDARYPYFALTINKIIECEPVPQRVGFSITSVNIQDNGIEVLGNNQISRGNLSLPAPFSLTIPYKNAKYDEFTALQKKIFDYYNFDKTQTVNVIGLSMDDFYQSFLLGGSISVNGKVGYARYQQNSSVYVGSSSIDHYQLVDESIPPIVIASLTGTCSPLKTGITLDEK